MLSEAMEFLGHIPATLWSLFEKHIQIYVLVGIDLFGRKRDWIYSLSNPTTARDSVKHTITHALWKLPVNTILNIF